MERGVDRGFVIAVVVVVVAAVFLSNVRPSVSGMGGTSFDGQGVGPTWDIDGVQPIVRYRGPSILERGVVEEWRRCEQKFVGTNQVTGKRMFEYGCPMASNYVLGNACEEEPIGTCSRIQE